MFGSLSGSSAGSHASSRLPNRQEPLNSEFAFGKSADTVAYIQRDGIRQRLEGGEFSRRYESVDEDLIAGKVGDDRV